MFSSPVVAVAEEAHGEHSAAVEEVLPEVGELLEAAAAVFVDGVDSVGEGDRQSLYLGKCLVTAFYGWELESLLFDICRLETAIQSVVFIRYAS